MHRRDLMKYSLFAGATGALLGHASAADSSKAGGAVPDARATNPLPVPASGNVQVAVLVGPGAEVNDYAGPWGVFEYARVGDASRNPFKLYTVAGSREAVRTSSGLVVLPDHTFADAPAPNVVVVPAMDLDKIGADTFNWLRSVQRDADLIMSICNGSFLLAKAGLLDGKKATCHHGSYVMLHSMYPSVTVIRGVRFVEDGKIATSGGLLSGLDLTMRTIERYFGREVAQETAQNLEYLGTGWMHPEINAQFAKRPTGDAARSTCWVCGMKINPETALTWKYEGKSYYFCSDDCKKNFMTNPKSFIEVG